MNIQKDCEIVEQLLQRDIKLSFLTVVEFMAINKILFALTVDGKYDLKEE